MKPTLTAAALVILTAQGALAQDAAAERPADTRPIDAAFGELRPGGKARLVVVSPQLSGQITGDILSSSAEGVTIADAATHAVHAIPASAIQRVEIGIERRKTKQGLMIGALIGAVSGVIVTADTGNAESVCGSSNGAFWVGRPCSSAERVGITIGVAAFYGGVGAWLGHRKTEVQWREVRGPRVSFRLAPALDGGRASVGLSF